MLSTRKLLSLVCLLAVCAAAPADERPPLGRETAGRVDYLRDVKPLLARRCTSCHGALRQNSGLRLDAGTLVRDGGDSGPAVVPGKPDESLLIEAVTGRGGFPLMPKEGGPLSKDEIALLERWIAEGAASPVDEPIAADPREHWAFRLPQRPHVRAAVPDARSVRDSSAVPAHPDWPRNPIDTFLAAEHDRPQLAPAAEAPRHLLLRRLYLDLIGLPPTPDELREFLVDGSPDAYEKIVDRLLASPHYGERWGRHWMDVWRYSDWYGYRNELRNSARHIWRWRDWIVESLNADKPYDRMVLEMLAADELSPTDRDALRATGYLVRSYFKFNRHTWLDSTIEHTGKAFLGITVNCARCHDHMYDPISQREYYQFRAIFEPHQVRTDPVPGETDAMKDGLPRAYDASLDAPTFLFERGNDKRPDKDNPLSPAVPEAVASLAEFSVAAVSLPTEAWYPGSQRFVQNEALRAVQAELDGRQAALEKSRATLAKARRQWEELSARLNQPVEAPRPGADSTPAEPPSAADVAALATAEAAFRDAEAAISVAEAQVVAARLALVSAEARIAADRARFADPPASNADELTTVAAQRDREAALRQAEAGVAVAELELARTLRKTSSAGRPEEKPMRDAKAKLDTARKRLQEVQHAVQKPESTYKPFSDSYPQTSSGRRLALARWIVDERNPLTARVAVNHIWLRHFGSALVPTVFDFGRNGSPPTQPALLDWLALELMGMADGELRIADSATTDHGPRTTDISANPQSTAWRMKRLHRLLVTSAAYRMASTAPDDHPGWSLDRDNRLLWRMNPRRMEAEVVRDSVLAVAGSLDRRMGGPEIDENQAQTLPRRSIYFRHAPEKHVPFLTMFDSASTNECYRRVETVVPQQALALTNSRLGREQSRRLALVLNENLDPIGSEPALSRTLGASGTVSVDSDTAFIHLAFERTIGRPPTDSEFAACRQFLEDQSARLSEAAGLTPLAAGGEVSLPPAAAPRARARESLVHVLLNHNEFITIR